MNDSWHLLEEKRHFSQTDKHNIDWPGMAFFAAAEGVPFTDVEVVTLRQRCVDQHTNACFHNCMETDLVNPIKWLDQHFKELNDPEAFKEFVEVQTHPAARIVVGVNYPEITDEAIERALFLLEKVDNYQVSSYNEFGPTIHIIPSEAYR
jgi:hypothetical protein